VPIPRFVRPFTKRVINPFTRRFAGRLPGFGMLTYVGRRSGRVYHTPLNVFRHGRDFVFALTYGADVEWVKNVLAAGGAELETGGKVVRLTDPELIRDLTRRLMPLPVRLFLGLIGVNEFLVMRAPRNGAAA
jgi:deazaflavin-dependent oxidoreductase (nitroreductase family)